METLRIFRREAPVSVLGPGRRAVVWVQGCPFACPGCIVPESWDPEDGEAVSVKELVEWVLAQPDIEGITLSGGEPMAQAAALVQLIEGVREQADYGVVCYTGYTWEHLQARGMEAQRALLGRIDLLIDGTYIERLHADRLWRGSANQRLLPLTERYRSLLNELPPEEDRSAGMEFFLGAEGTFGFAGVPAHPGFRKEFEARLAKWGIDLIPEKESQP